jgi:hypothetical protein
MTFTDQFFGTIAAAGFLLAVIVHGLTFAHVDVIEDFSSVWLLHVGLFLVAIPFVLSARATIGGRPSLAQLGSFFPRWARILLAVVGAYAFLNFALFIYLSGGGAPDIRDGRFVLHNHGTVIRELSEQEYHIQRAYIARGFSGHWLFFYLAPALYFFCRQAPQPPISEAAP